MNKIEKVLALGVVVAIILASIGIFTPQGRQALGAVVDTSYFDFFNAATGGGFQINAVNVLTGAGLQLNSTSNLVANHSSGICYIKPFATTITATATAIVDCQATAAVGGITGGTSALTGVQNNDFVVATLSTTTSQVSGTAAGLVIVGASASSTAGHIVLNIANFTGATFTWPLTGAASGTVSFYAER